MMSDKIGLFYCHGCSTYHRAAWGRIIVQVPVEIRSAEPLGFGIAAKTLDYLLEQSVELADEPEFKCPACGKALLEICTPSRSCCPHQWKWELEENVRTCQLCGLTQRAQVVWVEGAE